jgi:homocitrate synthase
MTIRANFVCYSTSKIKAMADVRPIAIDDADSIIRSFHLHLITSNPEQAVQNGEAVLNGNGV